MNHKERALPLTEVERLRAQQQRLIAAMLELIADLEVEVAARYEFRNLYEIERGRYNRAMQPIEHARELLAELEHELD